MSLEGPSTFANLKHNPLYIQLLNPQNHYTSGDRVEGVVRVDPTARPRNVSIVFKGFSVLYDKEAVPLKAKFFELSTSLFVSTGAGENFDILRQGTASDGKVELPFAFTFPHNVTLPPPSERAWWYPKDDYNHPRFQHSPGFLLPPSCSPVSPAVSGILAPTVMYILEARVDNTLRVRQDLFFIPPAPEYDLALLEPDLNFGLTLPKHCCRYKIIRTRKLLPGYSESSKLGKLRDKLVEKELFFGIESYAEIPFVRFNLFATAARILVIGDLVPVIVTVQHLERSDSLPEPPIIHLRRVRVQLHSAFHAFLPPPHAAKKLSKGIVDVTRDVTTLLDKKLDKADGKTLHDGLNLLDIEPIRLSSDKLLPSFTSYGMAMEYEIKVEIWGECADRDFSGFACLQNVQIVTGWTVPDSDLGGLPVTPGPAYEEVDPLAGQEPGVSATSRRAPNGAATQHTADFLPAYGMAANSAIPPVNPRSQPPLPPPPYADGARWA
ncbi:hypothetical protein IAQ61_007208 [Plenodomus lingam]|uniref:Arrestin-like N-terminal domain-containing protein n=1 Tax=Leptosphaeria maculans (strain JN3 / isolate v23.1.3 / race Av1-4-5-6-7-8) TaxID=985895 RepID=E5A1A6_LEPMJ|nr:hypothetical protein LEMA_P105010.1 [Plenodomus lingam JN3]KAH9867904.1 hypothetical protein IAQ61_007208 [Plenodomus lingam]CBX97370.1 hypothetical protein LEMA_P105010.1 [Plenodomus lingam JN3]